MLFIPITFDLFLYSSHLDYTITYNYYNTAVLFKTASQTIE
jgi:hypothetical protein